MAGDQEHLTGESGPGLSVFLKVFKMLRLSEKHTVHMTHSFGDCLVGLGRVPDIWSQDIWSHNIWSQCIWSHNTKRDIWSHIYFSNITKMLYTRLDEANVA